MGIVFLLLSLVYVLFVNFAAGDDKLLQLAVRYVKLWLIIINAIVLSAICGVAVFFIIRQGIGGGNWTGLYIFSTERLQRQLPKRKLSLRELYHQQPE